MKIVIMDGYALNPGDLSWSELDKFGEVTVYDRTPNELILERAKDAEVILVNKTPINRETIESLIKLKYIGVLATGYNVVDVKAAKDMDITVTNIPAYGVNSVAQFSMALLLELCHHIGDHDKAVKNGEWENCEDFCFWKHPLIELDTKTIGVVGMGRIGQAVAKIAQAFGMKVLAYDAFPKKDLENETLTFVELDELYMKSDVISLHTPLFDSTEGMINKESISKMKDGVLLVNTSRGQLIVEQDLADALNSGKIAGAALDVLAEEPASSHNPLMRAKNCTITPHIAWAPKEARQRLLNVAINNVAAFVDGRKENVITK